MIGRVIRIGALTRESNEGGRRTRRREGWTIEVGGQERVNGAAEWSARADKCRRQVGEHLGTIKRKSLRAEVERAGGVKHVHTHVITVGPDTQLRIVKEVRAKMKAIACISAGGVCRGRNGDAFVGDRSAAGGAGKLSYHPAVCEVIIEHD